MAEPVSELEAKDESFPWASWSLRMISHAVEGDGEPNAPVDGRAAWKSVGGSYMEIRSRYQPHLGTAFCLTAEDTRINSQGTKDEQPEFPKHPGELES